jgi:uncharacterized repeat protein (TIGR01451 family)
MSDELSRRRLLQGLGAAGATGLAGCAGPDATDTIGDATVRTDDGADAPCPPVEYVLNTGHDQSAGTAIQPGTPDDDWDVTGDEKNGPGSVPRDATVVDSAGWPSPFADSRWISIGPDSGSPLPVAPSQYEYTYCFCLNEGFRKPELSLRLQADDRVDDIRLNGHSLPFAGDGAFQGQPIEETYTDPDYFEAGENCLTVVVRDQHRVITGLNLVGRMRAANADCGCGCDLALTKRHRGQFEFGETGTYVIEVCNDGETDCDRAAVVEDALPDGVTFAGAAGNGWSASTGSGPLTFTHPNPGGLAPGDCLPPLLVRVEIPPMEELRETAVLRNCAWLRGGDADPTDDRDCDEVGCVEGERVMQAGAEDDYDTANPEPADPSDGLLAKTTAPFRDFDEGGSNRHFGHTFTDLRQTPLAGEICEAELELCLRPSGSSLDVNDRLLLGVWDDDGNRIDGWGRNLGNHDGSPGLFDTQWDAGSTGERCVTLDLSALPEADGSTTDILPLLRQHDRLSVYAQDDTAVDFARLRLRFCCDDDGGCDLGIEKRARGEFEAGGTGRYVVRVCNEGETPCEAPVEVTDRLPDGVELQAAEGDGWDVTASGGVVTAEHPNPGLAPGDCLPPLLVEVAIPRDYPHDRLRNCARLVLDGAVAAEDCAAPPVRFPGTPSRPVADPAEPVRDGRDR